MGTQAYLLGASKTVNYQSRLALQIEANSSWAELRIPHIDTELPYTTKVLDS